jgi:hypothetical protein
MMNNYFLTTEDTGGHGEELRNHKLKLRVTQ